MRKTTGIIIGFLLLILVISCQRERAAVETDTTIPVRIEKVAEKSIREYVTATGTAYAIKEALLNTEQAGRYLLKNNSRTGRPFAMGDRVREGELIVLLENPEYLNSIAIESKKLNFDSSEREYTKQKSIYEKGGITLSELTNAEKTLIDARYSYDNAQLSLKKLEIRAPFSGMIVDLPHFTSGQWLAANTDVVQIMDYSQLYSEVTLPGHEMGRSERGQKVDVFNYSASSEKQEGVVTQVSPALDPASRMFKLKIEISNRDLILKPGMFVKADIIVTEKDSVIVIPKDIIIDRRGRKTVFVVQRGIAVERRIQLGIQNPDVVEVTEGLEPEDQLVVEGFETLRNRSRVKVLQ